MKQEYRWAKLASRILHVRAPLAHRRACRLRGSFVQPLIYLTDLSPRCLSVPSPVAPSLYFAVACLSQRSAGMLLAGLGINGFGRIGRLVFRAAMANPDVELKAIDGREGRVFFGSRR